MIWDAVRVITRLIFFMAEPIPGEVKGFSDRTLAARRRIQQIQRMTAVYKLGSKDE